MKCNFITYGLGEEYEGAYSARGYIFREVADDMLNVMNGEVIEGYTKTMQGVTYDKESISLTNKEIILLHEIFLFAHERNMDYKIIEEDDGESSKSVFAALPISGDSAAVVDIENMEQVFIRKPEEISFMFAHMDDTCTSVEDCNKIREIIRNYL